ncbi:type IV pilus modification PilV family protein [Desulfobacula phenolica]|uniref:type IV pilus modification PilV family protein n=1 Tax=Desulfobacula phenolica TaxID=90732 RepID=UPI000ABAB6FE|nr:prepilin-type N-terminal cleavage/methylation domain-containing protein [Desulfobacula phenolica]
MICPQKNTKVAVWIFEGFHIKANQKGFTLLEIMVAVSIIAIAFTSVIKLHTQTVAMNIASNFYAKAPLLAQRIIAEWETGMATDTTPLAVSDYLKDFPGFAFDINHEALAFEDLYSGNPDDNDRLLVEIVCTILYNHGEYHYTAKSLRFISQ